MAFLAATVCQQNSHAKSRTEKWDRVQRRASRMIRRLRHMKNWERLRKWIHLAYRSPREESNYRLQLPYRKFPKSESQTLLQRCAMKGQEARSQNRIWEVPAKGGTKSGEKKKVSQKGYDISIPGGVQHSARQGLVQTDLTLKTTLFWGEKKNQTKWPPDVPCNLNFPMIPWVCLHIRTIHFHFCTYVFNQK